MFQSPYWSAVTVAKQRDACWTKVTLGSMKLSTLLPLTHFLALSRPWGAVRISELPAWTGFAS